MAENEKKATIEEETKKQFIKIDEIESIKLENKLLKIEVLQLKKQQFEKEYQEVLKDYQDNINKVNETIKELVEKYDIPDGYKFEPSAKGFILQ